jgi:hypothetical protein
MQKWKNEALLKKENALRRAKQTAQPPPGRPLNLVGAANAAKKKMRMRDGWAMNAKKNAATKKMTKTIGALKDVGMRKKATTRSLNRAGKEMTRTTGSRWVPKRGAAEEEGAGPNNMIPISTAISGDGMGAASLKNGGLSCTEALEDATAAALPKNGGPSVLAIAGDEMDVASLKSAGPNVLAVPTAEKDRKSPNGRVLALPPKSAAEGAAPAAVNLSFSTFSAAGGSLRRFFSINHCASFQRRNLYFLGAVG